MSKQNVCLFVPLFVVFVSIEGTTPKNIARLTVLVEDVNEEPTFIKKSYSAKVFNTVPYRFQVIRVEVGGGVPTDGKIIWESN